LTVVAFRNAADVGFGGRGRRRQAPSISLTTTVDGSLIYAVGNDLKGAIGRTRGRIKRSFSSGLTQQGKTFWVQRISSAVAISGAGWSTTPPTTGRWNFVAVEILSK
jgi:hypothetical protein